MSWLTGYKKPSVPEEDSREALRKKIEAERLRRAEQRSHHKKVLEEATASREEANKAIESFINKAFFIDF